jgi:hypothetical protein
VLPSLVKDPILDQFGVFSLSNSGRLKQLQDYFKPKTKIDKSRKYQIVKVDIT